MPEARRGFVYGVLAYAFWGLFPLYWPLLEPASPLEILAHRIIWSAIVVTIVVAVSGHLRKVLQLPRRALGRLALAAFFIAINWGVYIYGVNSHHVVETSLGYFINPLVTVVLGVVVLRERLRRVQWAALGLGLLAVIVITIDYGRPPWISLVLACSFGTYGLIKKQVGVPAAPGLVVESSTLVLPALIVIAVLEANGSGTWTGHGPDHLALLALAGVVTAVPLLLFAGAASSAAAVHAGRPAVPHPDAAAADRRLRAARADAAEPAGRIPAGLGGAGHAHRRRLATPGPTGT